MQPMFAKLPAVVSTRDVDLGNDNFDEEDDADEENEEKRWELVRFVQLIRLNGFINESQYY